MGDLRRALTRLEAGYDDEGVYVWEKGEQRLSYLLRLAATQVAPIPDEIGRRMDSIPDSARIMTVLLTAESANQPP